MGMDLAGDRGPEAEGDTGAKAERDLVTTRCVSEDTLGDVGVVTTDTGTTFASAAAMPENEEGRVKEDAEEEPCSGKLLQLPRRRREEEEDEETPRRE